jgi:hypothetical protein
MRTIKSLFSKLIAKSKPIENGLLFNLLGIRCRIALPTLYRQLSTSQLKALAIVSTTDHRLTIAQELLKIQCESLLAKYWYRFYSNALERAEGELLNAWLLTGEFIALPEVVLLRKKSWSFDDFVSIDSLVRQMNAEPDLTLLQTMLSYAYESENNTHTLSQTEIQKYLTKLNPYLTHLFSKEVLEVYHSWLQTCHDLFAPYEDGKSNVQITEQAWYDLAVMTVAGDATKIAMAVSLPIQEVLIGVKYKLKQYDYTESQKPQNK